MNILHLNMNYYNSKIHHNIVKSLNAVNQVDGIVFYPDYKKNIVFKNNENKDFWEKRYLKKVYCLNKIDRYSFYSRANKLHNSIVNNIELKLYDYSLAHSLYSNGFLAFKLKKTHGIKYSVIVTNTDINKYMKYMPHLKKTALEIMNEADNIIFSSPAYKEKIMRIVKDDMKYSKIQKNSTVIPFGIDDYWIENKNKNEKNIKFEIEERPLKILYVGKINKNKNIELTLKTLENINHKFSRGIEFIVIGEPEGKEGLKILNRLKKSTLVKYYGYADKSDLLEKYRASDIFIMTSLTESFGLVYAEAMSQGLPIIYSKGEGFDKHFKDGLIGHSVNARSSDEISDAIQKIIDNYNEISEQAFNNVIKFDWTTIAQSFIRKMEKD